MATLDVTPEAIHEVRPTVIELREVAVADEEQADERFLTAVLEYLDSIGGMKP